MRHQFWLRKPIAWSSHILGHMGHFFPLTHVAQKDYSTVLIVLWQMPDNFPQPIQAWERYLGISLGKRCTVLTDGVISRCENGGVNSSHGFSRLLPQHRKRTATRDKIKATLEPIKEWFCDPNCDRNPSRICNYTYILLAFILMTNAGSTPLACAIVGFEIAMNRIALTVRYPSESLPG